MDRLKQIVFRSRLWQKLGKNSRETGYWQNNAEKMVRWYRGEMDYRGFSAPEESERETRFDERKNAIMTYIAAETRKATYRHDLFLPRDSMKGKRVADIGSGPMPTLDVFSECERYCIDHLIDDYRNLGYPLEEYEEGTTFVHCKSEDMPFGADFFDAVISRNALDHVDDFSASCREILRVLKPDGWLHIQLHYHDPTATEPQKLDDTLVEELLESTGIRKIHMMKEAWGFKGGTTVVWSNIPEDQLEPREASVT